MKKKVLWCSKIDPASGIHCFSLVYLLQMISSCCFLYALKRLNLISFSSNESGAVTDSKKTFVSIKALINTSPLSLTYLLYMVIPFPSHNFPFGNSKISCSHAVFVSLKASLYGGCSGSKCTDVYNHKENYSCVHNDVWVHPGGAEVYSSSSWKVNTLYSSIGRCYRVFE